MDVFEAVQKLKKETTVDTIRRPLAPAEGNNGITTRRSRTREVSSRYKSPTPCSTSNSRRCPSPNLTRATSPSPQLASKRAVSAERKRPSTPTSTSRPSTPVSDTSAEQLGSSKKTGSSRLPEVLWPSTMRSLNVSFQSDSISIPVSKKEKPVTHALSDRTLKPSSNVAHKQAQATAAPRKSTPERKRSPLKGKNSSHHSENSRPVDGVQARLIDQHRWPSRAGGGRLSPSVMAKSVDLSDSAGKIPSSGHPSGGISLRRLSAEGIPKNSLKSSAVETRQSTFEEDIGEGQLGLKSVDDLFLRESALQKADALSSSRRASLGALPVRPRLSSPGQRLPSPSRTPISKASPSPVRTRPSTPAQSRGASPSRIRPSSPTRQSSGTASVLSFIADIKKGKKTYQLEDAHQLRLLHNRYLQWRFANAQADAAIYVQKITAEESLYNVWQTNLELWESVITKRVDVQRLKLELKLNLVLREQLAFLEDWAILEREHSASLDGAIKDLEASTLRLPVTGGAKADIDSLKTAINSAIDVMQSMGSSICSVLSKVEDANGLVSELAALAGQERAMLNECDALLASTSAMQVRECSLRTQLIQSHQDTRKTRNPILWTTS